MTTRQTGGWVAGRCWLCSGFLDAWVMWIGHIEVWGSRVPLYACAPCLDHLTAKAAQEVARRDAPWTRQYAAS